VRQLASLPLQIVPLPHQLPLPALKLGELNRFGEVGGQQALPLPVQASERLLDARLALLELLWQPGSAVSSLQGQTDLLRMLEYDTQVVPDQLLQLLGRNVPSFAALFATAAFGRRFASTQVIIVVRHPEPTVTLELTVSAADQPAQQIVMAGTPLRQLLVRGQPSLDPVKELLTDDRWYAYSNPRLGRSKLPTFTTSHGL
jgi:hypothetical protein